jgi:HEAT repeat protein
MIRLACILLIALAPPAPTSRAPSSPVASDEYYTLDEARSAAEQDGSLVLVIFNSFMDPGSYDLHQTLVSPDIHEKLASLNIVEVDVNMRPDYAQSFGVGHVPELVLITSELKIITRYRGVPDPDRLEQFVGGGRQMVADGVWEGLTLDGEASVTQRAGGVGRLIEALSERDPAARHLARARLMTLREEAVGPLITALRNDYLGERLAAAEVLREMAPQSPAYDPWLERDQRAAQVDTIAAWWADTHKLGPNEPLPLTPFEQRTVDDDVDAVTTVHPVRCTRAMSQLVRIGDRSLPAVRAAIAKCELNGDTRSLNLLEDVRWTILLPDTLELRVAARRTLARGSSEQRQAAAERLGATGTDALPALRELIGDDDSLVRESAIVALAQLGSTDALASAAAMLDADDPNLRMVAAQQLGATKQAAAGQFLVKAIDDPDEVVAITAIAAMQEVKAMDQTAFLIAALDDRRWRVRAAAAETLGKLEISAAGDKLSALLEDEDPFVTKTALEAFKNLKANPPSAALLRLATIRPQLLSTIVELLLSNESADAIEKVTELYEVVPADQRPALAAALAGPRNYNQRDDEYWRPLLDKLLADQNSAVRHGAATALKNRSFKLAGSYITQLLQDADPAVRSQAVILLVPVVAYHYGISNHGSNDQPEFGILANVSDDSELAEQVRRQHQDWHDLLQASTDQTAVLDVARFLTGDPAAQLADVPELLKGDFSAIEYLEASEIVGLILLRLPMPEAQSMIERLLDDPEVLVQLMKASQWAPPSVRQAVYAPQRLLSLLEQTGDNLSRKLLASLIGDDGAPGALVMMTSNDAAILAARLCVSESSIARATGLFTYAARPDLDAGSAIETAMTDPDEWVRRTAVLAFLERQDNQMLREATLAPLLTDPSPHVASVAAAGLLANPLWIAAELPEPRALFAYGSSKFDSPFTRSYNNPIRPPQVIRRQVAFLDALHSLLNTQEETTPPLRDMVPLVLAQYGDFSALERALADWGQDSSREPPRMLLITLPLTRDARYLQPLRKAMERMDSAYEYRDLLQWLRGVNGEEARQMRREINERMRAAP